MLGTALAVAAIHLGSEPARGGVRDPGPVVLTAGASSMRAVLGSYCLRSTRPHEESVCVDAQYVPARGGRRLSVRPGALVVLTTRPAASAVRAELLRAQGGTIRPVAATVRARPSGADGRRWVLRLPRRLAGGNLLSLDLRYGSDGDAAFWAPLRLAC